MCKTFLYERAGSISTNKEMITINCLPPEVLWLVFQNLDGYSFIRCSRVCRKWYSVSQNVDKQFWKRTCRSEIDQDILEELCGFRCTSDIQDNGLWKSVYAKWAKTNVIKSYQFYTKMFEFSELADVTCIKNSGSWIVTGHLDGKVYAWDPLRGKKSVLVQHLKYVSDLALVDLVRAGQYGSIEKPWDHHHVISISGDCTVNLTYLLLENAWDYMNSDIIYIHGSSLENVRVFEDKAVISATNNHYLIFSLELERKPFFIVNMVLFKDVIGPEADLECFSLWHNVVLGVCCYGHSEAYSIKTDKWNPSTFSSVTSKLNSLRDSSRHSLLQPYVFRRNIIFLRSGHGSMFICAGEELYCKFRVMKSIRCGIESIALQGSLLAFGTDSGHLLLYHVPHLSDLLRLEITHPSWSHDLHMGPVTCIEISDDGDSPIVIASSSGQMTVVKWYKEKPSKMTARFL